MVSGPPTLHTLRRLGLTLESDPDGHPRVRGARPLLRSATFEALAPYRARILAEWCLTTTPPPALAWDPAVAEALITLVVDAWATVDPAGIALAIAWGRHRLQPLAAWHHAQAAMRQAERDQDLAALAAAGRHAVRCYAALAPPRVRRPAE